MPDYKTIKGALVKILSSDPSPLYEGQLWYNSTDRQLRVTKSVNQWSNGGNLNTNRMDSTAAGTRTAGLLAGGAQTANRAESEEYNGTAWSEGENLAAVKRRMHGFGTQTAALSAGGLLDSPTIDTAQVEEYNGTSWSETTDYNNTRSTGGGAGTASAGLMFGGFNSY